MAKEWAKKIYKRKAWQDCRAAYIAKRVAIDGGMCEECKEELGYIVHHTILLTPDNIDDPDIVYNHDYLEYVCKKCHDNKEDHFNKFAKKKPKATKKGFKFNSNGEFVKIEDES